MQIYKVRKSLTNSKEATEQGEVISAWTSWIAASHEVDRLFVTQGIQCYISTSVY